MEDEKEITLNWLEGAKETFDLAVESNDYETCKLVIDDIFDKGFTKESLVFEDLLSALPLHKFAIKSPAEY